MEFEAFRVQNYKRVEDTGWIGCRDLTVLVGKNEAGKSAVLRGLSKVKPSDGEEYDGLREFPRRRFTDEFESEDWPAASVRLRLDADEQAGLRDISPELTNVTHTEVTRLYSGKYEVGFDPEESVRSVAARDARKAADEALERLGEALAPDGRGEELGAIKQQIQTTIGQIVSALPESGSIPVERTDALLSAVNPSSAHGAFCLLSGLPQDHQFHVRAGHGLHVRNAR